MLRKPDPYKYGGRGPAVLDEFMKSYGFVRGNPPSGTLLSLASSPKGNFRQAANGGQRTPHTTGPSTPLKDQEANYNLRIHTLLLIFPVRKLVCGGLLHICVAWFLIYFFRYLLEQGIKMDLFPEN